LVVAVERPVAGGRMLARHEGRVVLVHGAIPGERVVARVERVSSKVVLAQTVEVLDASPHRRAFQGDAGCGGLAFAHVQYEHQLALKAEIVADAFRRIGRLSLPAPLAFMPSPEQGYRWRARLHIRHGQVGFFREGTRELCDASGTGQLTAESLAAIETLVTRLGSSADDLDAVTMVENRDATSRIAHLEPRAPAAGKALTAAFGTLPTGWTGVTLAGVNGVSLIAGEDSVSDDARSLGVPGSDVPTDVTWRRSPASFFQSNRYLVGALVAAVMGEATGDRVLDLYSGVGLFAVPLVAQGAMVVAVEGDPSSGTDLEANTRRWAERVAVRRESVEAAVTTHDFGRLDTVILDPPRTGASTEALDGVLRIAAGRLVYVSCDPATLARDAAIITRRGYELRSLAGFDMFPNTPHVETMAVFEKA
jgi:23S rRNA (uracil1939-C5)-methyltransferase